MKYIVAFILSASSWLAHALDYEISAGHTTFQKPPNTIWYQREFPHIFDLNSGSYSVGVSDYMTSTIRWRAAYTRIGDVLSDAQATSDAIYTATGHCVTGVCPLNTYRTEGSVRGFSLTLAPEKQVGGVKVSVEVGAFIYMPKFYAEVAGCASCTVTDRKEYSEGWKVGPQIGVGVEYQRVALVLTAYKIDAPTPDVDAVPNWGPWAANVSMRVRF